MPFKKGQSGNPGGRPRELKDIQDLARKSGADAIAALVKVAKDGKSEAARVSAAVAILDRGFGKPLQQIDAIINDERAIGDLSGPELDRRLADAIARVETIASGASGATTSQKRPDNVRKLN